MKKVKFIYGIILLSLLLAISCNDNTTDNNTIQSEAQLEGTKWKLIGFYDVEKNELREVEPKNCEKCFTLEFDTDSTAQGMSLLNYVYCRLKPKLIMGKITKAYEITGDGTMYTDTILPKVENYSCKEDVLKFYYNNKKNYLLYVLINDNKEEE